MQIEEVNSFKRLLSSYFGNELNEDVLKFYCEKIEREFKFKI